MSYKVKRPCRVCGKLFTPCGDCEKDKSAFHWRSVACSMECAKEYFRRVEESRNKSMIQEENPAQKNENVVAAPEIEKTKKKRTRKTKTKNNEESE